MPPAISDDESDMDQEQLAIHKVLKNDDEGSEMDEDAKSEEETPEVEVKKPRGGRKSAKKVEEPKLESEEEDDDDDEEEEIDDGEYVVEAIKDHIYKGGKIMFLVKWEGYEKKADMTWEPEDSLVGGAEEILETYLDLQGGREAIIQQSKDKSKRKRTRKSAVASSETSTPKSAPAAKRSRKNTTQAKPEQHPAYGTPPATANDKWSPPVGSWEDEIDDITTEPDEKGKLTVYLTWKNGKMTRHDTAVVYKKCPQRMLKFYEQHVRIVTQAE